MRSQNNIALAIASSGIAATLLDGGRTTHSALKLPLNLQNTEAPNMQHRPKAFWNGKLLPNVSNYHMGRMYNVSQRKHWKRLIVPARFQRKQTDLRWLTHFYCHGDFHKHCPLYHDQHPLMNFMRNVLNHQFYGVIYRN
ncbi:hypothetical protein TNCV_216691 [Trichonephila clavipes]|nr:hypothetical protein TNCV_216691 [Trichonephila clavipes]